MSFSQTARVGEKVPVIDVTDLYYPAQDFGDNFDIIVPYAHPGVDLRAVILDVTDRFRRRVSKHLEFTDDRGPREPGFVPIRQLNYIFKVDTPHAMGPRQEMVDAADTMSGLNGFDAAGVDLILRTLRESDTPVEVLVFGSARSVAVAMNRASGLFAEKVGRIHLSAGASDPEYLEWNASLDPTAIDTLFAGPTPLTLYPCATGGGPFDLGVRNTYWRIDSLDFIRRMRAPLRNYLIDGLR
ncbi:MAG: hypothetical protein FWF28_03185, partial [Micrococcales bacterium]|nr:hypothetical protein [Micrococcales bacterium]